MANSTYTNVKIINQNNPDKSFSLQIPNAEITGNSVKYRIENGKVYKLNRKTDKYEQIKDNAIKLTGYQATAIKVAASGDKKGESEILNWDDLTGPKYGPDLDEALKISQSEYQILKDEYKDSYCIYQAEASEHGVFTAFFENINNEKRGRLQIRFDNKRTWHFFGF